MCSDKVADTEDQSHRKDWTAGIRQSRQLTSMGPLPREAKVLRHRGLGTKDQEACPVPETRRTLAGAVRSPRSAAPQGLSTYLATARSTWGSCSHFFRASTLLVFLWGLASRKMASAHRTPETHRHTHLRL